MHIVTGGAGFIGSAMVWKLNRIGIDNVWIVDDLGVDAKWKNIQGLEFSEIFSPEDFKRRVMERGGLPEETESVIHMGACSATTEADADYLLHNNFNFTRILAEYAVQGAVRLVVASSAATYGGGEHGYGDGVELLGKLRPLNMYGHSKLMFDRWAAKTGNLNHLASLRFFNVYGPNEYHKGDMASMVYKSFRRVVEDGRLSLFKSHRAEFADGEQMRDFVYVKDVVEVMAWLIENPGVNGIYNVGTGVGETWNQLARAVFAAVGKPPRIDYVDMPENIRHQYQYQTRADISRLRDAGYKGEFRLVSAGVHDYVVNHLMRDNPYIDNADYEKSVPATERVFERDTKKDIEKDGAFFEPDLGTRAPGKREGLPEGIVRIPANRLIPWDKNPRLTFYVDMKSDSEERKKADDKLKQGFEKRVAAGLDAWSVEHPAIVLLENGEKYDPNSDKRYPVKQGNCRLKIIHAYFPEQEIPCQFETLSSSSLLTATRDGKGGQRDKSDYDVKLAIIWFLQKANFTETECRKHFYNNYKELFKIVSPIPGNCKDDAKKSIRDSSGAFQTLFRVSKLPDQLIYRYCQDLTLGKNKRTMTQKTVEKLYFYATQLQNDPDKIMKYFMEIVRT